MKLFISHATEDKAAVARPLAEALQRRGFTVWYDEFVLRLGDSLQQSIDRGLAECDFGVVVLSKAFFSKRWPQQELSGLFAREFSHDQRIVLPVWHGVNAEDIRAFSPMVADRVAVSTSKGLPTVVDEIERSTFPNTAFAEQLSEWGSRPHVEYTADSASHAHAQGPSVPSQFDGVAAAIDKSIMGTELKRGDRACPSCQGRRVAVISSRTSAAEGTFTRHYQVLQCSDCGHTLSE